jgi:hypothetical protein
MQKELLKSKNNTVDLLVQLGLETIPYLIDWGRILGPYPPTWCEVI